MMSFAKRNKSVSVIVVHKYDRFSRTGPNAQYISSQLKKSGILVLSVTQPLDPSTAMGEFQESMHYLLANDLLMSYRRIEGIERALRGIETRLKRPIRLGTAIVELETHYADLAADFDEVAHRLQLEARLGHVNRSNRAIRREIRLSAEARRVVEEIYSDDFSALEY